MVKRFLLWMVLIAAAFLVLAPTALAQTGEGVDNDLTAWATITGIFLPLAVAVVNRHKWTAQTKMIVAVVLAVIDGVVVTGLTHGWEFDGTMLVTVAGVLTLSQVTYRNIWLKFGDDSTPPGEEGPANPSSPPLIKALEKTTG
jgi:hypothetical protein